jgi:hypothetical protein
MAAAENSLRNAGKVDFDVISSDIDEYNLEASRPRVRHHLEITLSRQSCFDAETFAAFQIGL